MSYLMQAYIVCFAGGLILIGAEVLVPGGILGLIGGICLTAAAVIGLTLFPAPWNFFNIFLIVFIAVGMLLLWLKYFSKTAIGRGVTLSESSAGFKSSGSANPLEPGAQGITLTALRPAGIAEFNGNRTDVIAEGDWVDAGTHIQVIKAQGNHITVRLLSGKEKP